MKDFRADLHCHTTCSDGTLSPEELIFHAKEVGLLGISITDHDNISAYPRAIEAAEKAGIWLGSGVEFSSVNEGFSVHILGYDIDIHDPELAAFCSKHIQRRKERNREIMSKLERLNMPIDVEKLEKMVEEGKPVGRPHIALEMLKEGYIQNIQEAFDRFLGDKMPCFHPGMPISTDETIEVIHKAGGKAFLAHPHFIHNARRIRQLMEKPFDGIECYYAKIPSDQEGKWLKIAREKGLLISGGSDFHGDIKPHNPLGCSWVDEITFDQIFQKNRWKF